MKEMIRIYLKELTKDHIRSFAQKNNISYQEEELDQIYHFIQNHYEELLEEKIEVFEILKPKISNELYKKVLHLYIEYKQKYL